MVILGNGSDRDVCKALEELQQKQTMGQTHEQLSRRQQAEEPRPVREGSSDYGTTPKR